MSENHARKRTTRLRMAATGENYTEARTRLAMLARIPGQPSPIVRPDDSDDEDLWGQNRLNDLLLLDWDGEGRMIDDVTPESVAHDNTRRAGFALAAVEAYRDKTGTDDATAIPDMLSDLRHLCDALGLDFHAMVSGTEMYYGEESRGEL